MMSIGMDRQLVLPILQVVLKNQNLELESGIRNQE